MALVLETNSLNEHLGQLMRDANRRLWLLSSYVELSRSNEADLAKACERGVEVCLIYGKERSQGPAVLSNRRLAQMEVRYLSNHHAKCYLSEDRVIIGSMNLVGYSQTHNEEMGVLLTRDGDPEAFKSAWAAAERLHALATAARRLPSPEADQVAEPGQPGSYITLGYCLECGARVPRDRRRPLCAQHEKEWRKWSDLSDEYPRCHHCGQQTGSTVSMPLCERCEAARSE